MSLESQGFVQGRENVARVDKNATVASVLPLLYEKQLSTVAIVDSQGKFLGNFSASDLRVKISIFNYS
jgi:CBS domain-containing protein